MLAATPSGRRPSGGAAHPIPAGRGHAGPLEDHDPIPVQTAQQPFQVVRILDVDLGPPVHLDDAGGLG